MAVFFHNISEKKDDFKLKFSNFIIELQTKKIPKDFNNEILWKNLYFKYLVTNYHLLFLNSSKNHQLSKTKKIFIVQDFYLLIGENSFVVKQSVLFGKEFYQYLVILV